MAVTQYIGARYVPMFADPAEWSDTKAYEPLTIVIHEGNSYTSRQSVPVGIDISDGRYWVLTGNYDAQVEAYRQEVANLGELLPSSDFSPDSTVNDALAQILSNMSEMLGDFYHDIGEPVFDTYGNTTYVHVMVPRDTPLRASYTPSETIMDYAQENSTTLTINAGVGGGLVISDGQVLNTDTFTQEFYQYIAFDNDNGYVRSFPIGTDPSTIIAAGYDECVMAYYQNVKNGNTVDFEALGLPETNYDVNPRSGIFLDSYGNKHFIATNGRMAGERGLTPQEFADLMLSQGAVNGWNLDGGGSTCLIHKGVRLTRGYDDYGLSERGIHIGLSVPRKEENASLEALQRILNTKVNSAAKMSIPNEMRQSTNLDSPDLDTVNFNGFYSVTSATNGPYESTTAYLIVCSVRNAHGATRAMQIAMLPNNQMWVRAKSSGTWLDWSRVDIASLLYTESNQDIPSNTDFNNIVKPGRYQVLSSGSAATMTNIPSPYAGILYVVGANQSTFVNQIYIDSSGGAVFIRRVKVSDHTTTTWTTYANIVKVTNNITISSNSYALIKTYVSKSNTIIGIDADGYICIPFRGSSDEWFVKILDLSMQPLADGTVVSNVNITYTTSV